jgi:hypothetical protein
VASAKPPLVVLFETLQLLAIIRAVCLAWMPLEETPRAWPILTRETTASRSAVNVTASQRHDEATNRYPISRLAVSDSNTTRYPIMPHRVSRLE